MKKTLIAFGLLTSVAFFAGCSTAGTTGDIQASVFQNVTGGDAKTLIAGTAGLTILDVRTPEEYATGHLENAINIDVKASSFRDEIGKLDKGKPYMVYCRSGKRSLESAKVMKELGFTNVNNLTGGITQWQADGGNVVK